MAKAHIAHQGVGITQIIIQFASSQKSLIFTANKVHITNLLFLYHYLSRYLLPLSTMAKRTKQCLSSFIAKAIAKNQCDNHQQPLTQICLSSLKIGCKLCRFDKTMQIEEAIKNPIQIAIAHLQHNNYSELQHNLKSVEEHKKIYLGFCVIIEQLRKQVNAYCEEIMQQFKSKWEQAFQSCTSVIGEIKQAQSHYRSVFEELLQSNFRNGDKAELQNIFNQFCHQCSEDPTDYLNIRIEHVLQSQQIMPIVDWDGIRNTYSVITDSKLWEITNFIKPCLKDEIKINCIQKQRPISNSILLVPQINNKLTNGGYSLKFNEKGLAILIYENQELKQISKLNTQIDSIYEVGNYKLIGINYEQISIFSYCFGKLKLIKTYQIRACSHILVYSDCIIAEAEGRIIRLWLSDGYKQIVSLLGNNLEYGYDDNNFNFTDGRNQIVTHPAFHNQL